MVKYIQIQRSQLLVWITNKYWQRVMWWWWLMWPEFSCCKAMAHVVVAYRPPNSSTVSDFSMWRPGKKGAHLLIKHQPTQWWQHALLTIHHILKNHIPDHSRQNTKKHTASHQHNSLCHVRPSNRRRSVFRPKTCIFQTCPCLASLSWGFWSAKWGRGFCLDRKDLAKASWSPETKKKD